MDMMRADQRKRQNVTSGEFAASATMGSGGPRPVLGVKRGEECGRRKVRRWRHKSQLTVTRHCDQKILNHVGPVTSKGTRTRSSLN